MLKYAINDTERAEAFWNIGSKSNNTNNFVEGLSYLDKAINTYKSILKRRRLDPDEAWTYCLSYLDKGLSLEGLCKYEEAIDIYTTGKKITEKYKNEEFYQNLIDSFNEGLSICYKKLVK